MNEIFWPENGGAHSPAVLQARNHLRCQQRKYHIGGKPFYVLAQKSLKICEAGAKIERGHGVVSMEQ
jgi:hypothetical protein